MRRARVRARPALTERVLGRACSVAQGGTTSLAIASSHGHAAIAQLLLAHGADVDLADDNGWTPLFHSCLNGHTAVAKLLLAAKANPLKAIVEGGGGGVPAGSTPLDVAKERWRGARRLQEPYIGALSFP